MSITDSLLSGLTEFFSYLPAVLGAIVVLVVGFFIAKIIKGIVSKLLQKAKVDEKLHDGQSGEYVERFVPGASAADFIGKVFQYVVMVFVLVAAVSVLQIPAVTDFMNLVLAYLPNVIAALFIFMVAVAIAGAVGGLVHRTMGDTPTGKVVRAAAPTLVMAIAVFMILTQLNIAPVIVTATYVALIGALALGSAIAFGLGGREAAADMLNSGYRKAQEQREQVRRDLETGRERGQQDAQRAREKADGQGGGGRDDRPTAGGQPATGSYRAR